MKLKNKQILTAIEIKNELENVEMPVSASYKIAKNMSKLEKEVLIIAKEEKKLLNRYATKDDQGKPIMISDGQFKCDDVKEFTEKMEELLSLETDVDIMIIPIEQMNCNIKPNILSRIMFMIGDDD